MTEQGTCKWSESTGAPVCSAPSEASAPPTEKKTYVSIAQEENLLSAKTFGKLLKAGYALDRDKKLRILQKEGYVYDEELSSPKVTVVYNPNTKHAVVVFKGTNPMNVNDVWTDLHILGGTKPGQLSRVVHSRDLIERAKKKYGQGNVIAAGHSLGGYLAQHSGADHVMTWNKLSVGDEKETLAPYQTDFRNRSDVASMLRDSTAQSSDTQHTVELKGGKWYLPVSTHRRFTPLFRGDVSGQERPEKNFLEHLAVLPAQLARAPIHVLTDTALSDYAVHSAQTFVTSSTISLGTAAGAAVGSIAGPVGTSLGAALGTYIGSAVGSKVNERIRKANEVYKDPTKSVHRARRKAKK